MRIRIRGPAGQSSTSLADTATVGDLWFQISGITSLLSFDVKYGYPPKPFECALERSNSTKLSELGIQLDGEQLIVSESGPSPHALAKGSHGQIEENAKEYAHQTVSGSDPVARSSQKGLSSFSFRGFGTAPSSKPRDLFKGADAEPPLSSSRKESPMDAPELALPSRTAMVLLRIMPDDNSCLFRAFGSAFFGEMDNMTELRSIIAQTIQTQPEIYSEVVLDQKPDDYCLWIQCDVAWGGFIELQILSKHFDIEVCSIDVQTLRIDRFNEGKPKRCILVYSGIHYDTIAISPCDKLHDRSYTSPEFDTKVFDAADQDILDTAVDLCRVLQRRHYYTDTALFGVRCNICGAQCVGEKGATEHAKLTGHYDFGEAS